MKIIVSKNQTEIYALKKDRPVLKKAMKEINALKYFTCVWNDGKFIVKHPFSQYQKSKIIKAFRTELENSDKKTVITGFKGCLITGFKLEWL